MNLEPGPSSAEVLSKSTINGPSELDNPDFERGFRFWAIIIGLGISTLLAALEHTVVTTAGPLILEDLDLKENFVWITNAFFICRCVNTPLRTIFSIFGLGLIVAIQHRAHTAIRATLQHIRSPMDILADNCALHSGKWGVRWRKEREYAYCRKGYSRCRIWRHRLDH